MEILVWRELVASEHSGWKSCVRDTTMRSTLGLFPILMDNGFLPIVTKKNVCFSVYGSFVSVGQLSWSWHGRIPTTRSAPPCYSDHASSLGHRAALHRTHNQPTLRSAHFVANVLCLMAPIALWERHHVSITSYAQNASLESATDGET